MQILISFVQVINTQVKEIGLVVDARRRFTLNPEVSSV